MVTPIIFVIDDDDAVRCALVRLLEVHGFRVESYKGAGEFLERAHIQSVGVAVADLLMPGLTGEELQQRLLAARSVLSVVVVTGMADVRATVRIMQRGAVTLLEKPFSEEELIEAVQAGVERSRARAAERAEICGLAEKLATFQGDDRTILQRMIAGCSIKSCSHELHLSTRTIERRRRAILDFMQAGSIPELAVMVERARAFAGESAGSVSD